MCVNCKLITGVFSRTGCPPPAPPKQNTVISPVPLKLAEAYVRKRLTQLQRFFSDRVSATNPDEAKHGYRFVSSTAVLPLGQDGQGVCAFCRGVSVLASLDLANQEPIRNHPGTIQESIRNHSEPIKEPIRNHSGTDQEPFRNHSGTIRNHSGPIQEPISNRTAGTWVVA